MAMVSMTQVRPLEDATDLLGDPAALRARAEDTVLNTVSQSYTAVSRRIRNLTAMNMTIDDAMVPPTAKAKGLPYCQAKNPAKREPRGVSAWSRKKRLNTLPLNSGGVVNCIKVLLVAIYIM